MLWELLAYDVITIVVSIRHFVLEEGRANQPTERGWAYQNPIPYIQLYLNTEQGGFIRTTQPPRPEIDFSFVKIRFLVCVCVVLMKVYQSKRSSGVGNEPLPTITRQFYV